MRRVPADRRKPACSRQRHCQLPPTRQLRSKLHVSERAEQPQKPDRMRQPSQRRDQRGSNPIDSPPSPQNRQSKASQPQRQVVVHETHVEGIAVGQHGDARREKPRRALRYRGNKRENAPEENQRASGNNNLLRRGNTHGTRINAEIAKIATIRHPENRQHDGSLPSSSVRISANRRPRFTRSHRAAFYYLLPAADAQIQSCRVYPPRTRGGTDQGQPAKQCHKMKMEISDEGYLEAWFSPRRFRRSRKRRCNGVGVLGLKATRYHSGWLRSRLSQVNVEASAFGCRATFSRIAPYGCFASLFSVLALARGCSLIRRSR